MKSDHPPDSSSFDALWESIDAAEEGLPPTLAPSLLGKPRDDRTPPAPPRDPAERDTVAPPMPPAEYAQTLMELSELDDPGHDVGYALPAPRPAALPRPSPPRPPPRSPATTGKPFGLVLASESDFISDHAEPTPWRAPVGPALVSPNAERDAGPPRKRSTGKFPAVQPRAPVEAPPSPFNPRSAARVPYGGMGQATGRGGGSPVETGAARVLPVPRAPSVPPVEPEEQPANAFDALDALDTLDGLGSLDSLDVPRSPDTFDALDAGFGLEPDPDSARRHTPPAFSMPSSSKPVPSAPRRGAAGGVATPVSVGLRLAKKTPPPPSDDEDYRYPGLGDAAGNISDRITPVGDSAHFAWPGAAEESEPSEAPLSPWRTPDSGPRSSPAVDPPISEAPPSSLTDRAREMMALFEARNFSSALVLAESVLVSDPTHPHARRCAESCREMLTEKYLGSLGGRANVPRVTMEPEEIRVLSLDHRAGFLLSFIDGSMCIDEVLDVSSMPELDALRIMFELRMEGVIEIVEPNRRPGRR